VGRAAARELPRATGSGSFLSVNRLSLQIEKVCSGKIERIFPSIDFSSKFSWIHVKETQK